MASKLLVRSRNFSRAEEWETFILNLTVALLNLLNGRKKFQKCFFCPLYFLESREPNFGKRHLKLTGKLQFDEQGFEAVLMLENGISSN